jgi:hypothetical protein
VVSHGKRKNRRRALKTGTSASSETSFDIEDIAVMDTPTERRYALIFDACFFRASGIPPPGKGKGLLAVSEGVNDTNVDDDGCPFLDPEMC